MIKITNLNKFYKTRRNVLHALKDVNLTLPDKGMVFVLGKSGSGKSTFLNLIGGLDCSSSGQIIVDGNDISRFSERKFTHYRNSCVGFIFQDHHLIDDLTVFQNIKLVLDLRHIREKSLISKALEQVGLKGYEERYPRELSGGERQRVAIARAIVKRPRIILADEPTGNLDGKNAAEVMKILKELSKNCLVLTVSHNTAEVQSNADRIIELSDGRIVGDVTRNPDYKENATLENNTIHFPSDRPMNETDVSFINENLSRQSVKKFALSGDKFNKTANDDSDGQKVPIEKTRLRLGQTLSLSFTFLKTKLPRIIGVAIPLAMVLLIILLAQTYINFDGNRILADRMRIAGQDAIVMSKQISLDGIKRDARKYHATVTKEDLAAFLQTGFDGKTYPILNISLPITDYKNGAGIKSSYFDYGVAATESLGTVCVDEAFFTEKFGKVEYLARSRNPDPLGLIITDYLADVIINTNSNYQGKPYTALIGDYIPESGTVGEFTINAVIRTDYQERYEELIDRVVAKKETDIAVLYSDENFQKLSSELYSFLAYTYTLNPNYAQDYLAAEHTYAWSQKLCFNGKIEYLLDSGYVRYNPDASLKQGQITMGIETYNAIFGTSYNSESVKSFPPQTVSLSQYTYYDTENTSPLFTVQVEIVGLYRGSGITVSKDVLDLFEQNHVRQTGIYFNDLSYLSDMLEVAEERHFIQESLTLEGILTLNRCVHLFVIIFRLVNLVLCGAVIFIFVNFSTKMIRDKLHEIGIMKALGTDRGTINTIFGVQIGLIALFTCLIAGAGYYFLVEPANTLFILSLREMVPSQLVLDLDVLVFLPKVLGATVLLIVLLAIISLAAPMSKIGKIRPVQIINNRD